MANFPETQSDCAMNDQFLDNPAEVNSALDLTALKPLPKKKIGRPNEERKAKQLLDRIATKMNSTPPPEGF